MKNALTEVKKILSNMNLTYDDVLDATVIKINSENGSEMERLTYPSQDDIGSPKYIQNVKQFWKNMNFSYGKENGISIDSKSEIRFLNGYSLFRKMSMEKREYEWEFEQTPIVYNAFEELCFTLEDYEKTFDDIAWASINISVPDTSPGEFKDVACTLPQGWNKKDMEKFQKKLDILYLTIVPNIFPLIGMNTNSLIMLNDGTWFKREVFYGKEDDYVPFKLLAGWVLITPPEIPKKCIKKTKK